jgi:hypothetical protein
MPRCTCCGQQKSDVQTRPLLRAYDSNGLRTIRPFDGPLCQDCNNKAQHFGTSEHSWLLKQLTEKKAVPSGEYPNRSR